MNTRPTAANAAGAIPDVASRGSGLPMPFVPPSMRGGSVITTVEQLRGAATLAALNAHETPPAGNDGILTKGTGTHPKRPPPATKYKTGAANRVKELPTTGTNLEGFDDEEFVRIVSLESKRRGFVVAMRLSPEDTNASRFPGTEASGRSRIPTFPFHPSSITPQNEENWNSMFLRLKEFLSRNDGRLSSLIATGKSKGGDHQADLAKWREPGSLVSAARSSLDRLPSK
ncbi:hypothetical protein THAOC_36966 [Thalassiosira oceanica]|uniref:Uncharacterized protein n=1 Tax=Thalassiosira oceanica TaxID=159749 RepID=K0QYV4_THAOC|nr:hypothetical protein THAOC_36966 [Thalassiosira oceanica]|eukprot:EJK44488.1 hypothetical protein THAOC_36966 [Thalassiosira oceanica]